jgi:hypothetical protein
MFVAVGEEELAFPSVVKIAAAAAFENTESALNLRASSLGSV